MRACYSVSPCHFAKAACRLDGMHGILHTTGEDSKVCLASMSFLRKDRHIHAIRFHRSAACGWDWGLDMPMAHDQQELQAAPSSFEAPTCERLAAIPWAWKKRRSPPADEEPDGLAAVRSTQLLPNITPQDA
jgi:hypothetical protein